MNANLRWIGGATLAGVLLAVAVRPKGDIFPAPQPRTPADSLHAAWRRASRDLNILASLRTRAIALELARALPPAKAGEVGFRYLPPLEGGPAGRIERILRQELATIAPDGPAHPITVIARVDSIALGGSYLRTVVLPERADQPCVVVYNASPQNLRFPGVPTTDRLLGPCAFYAAFGLPSPAVRQWLDSTGMRAATHLQRPAALAGDTGVVDTRYYLDRRQLGPLACRAGRVEACDALLTPERQRWEDLWYGWRPTRDLFEAAAGGVPGTESFGPGASLGANWVEAGLLAELATDLGRDRFRAIWTDERPLPESFESREGRPLRAWLHDYVERRVEPHRAGSRLAAFPLALAIGLTVAATAVGILRAPRTMS